MTEQCKECRSDRDITTEGRLSRIEARLGAIDDKLDDVIISGLRDHERRIAGLERKSAWSAGWIAGAGAVGGMTGGVLVKIAGIWMK